MRHLIVPVLIALLTTGCRDFSVDADGNGNANVEGDLVATLGIPFELAFGQRVHIDETDYSVEFTMVTEENRCLRTVQCVQAGRAGVLLTITDAQLMRYQLVAFIPGLVATPYAFNDIIQFQGYRFRLLQVAPYPEEGRNRDMSEYSVMLEVEPLEGL